MSQTIRTLEQRAGVPLLAYTFEPVALPPCRQDLLEQVLQPYCQQTSGFFLYFPSRAQVMPKLRAFIDFAGTRQGLRRAAEDLAKDPAKTLARDPVSGL